MDSDSLIRATLIDFYNKNSVSKCLARKSRNLVSVESKGLVVFLIFHDGSILSVLIKILFVYLTC